MFGNIETTKLTAVSTFVLAIATISVAIYLGYQTTIMSNDFDINNRPWIGGVQFRIFDDVVLFDIQNFGNIPNDSGYSTLYALKVSSADSVLEKDAFFELFGDGAEIMPLAVIMPSQKISITITGDILQKIKEVREGNGALHLGVILEYEYSNEKNGEYGLIGKYNPRIDTFDIIETWAK